MLTGDWTQQEGPEDARVEKHMASLAVRTPSVKMQLRSARGQAGGKSRGVWLSPRELGKRRRRQTGDGSSNETRIRPFPWCTQTPPPHPPCSLAGPLWVSDDQGLHLSHLSSGVYILQHHPHSSPPYHHHPLLHQEPSDAPHQWWGLRKCLVGEGLAHSRCTVYI